jgi:hypothetical protein
MTNTTKGKEMNVPDYNSIEGAKPARFIQADLGNGFASYALHSGYWFSVNGTAELTNEVRWACSVRERDQITALLNR